MLQAIGFQSLNGGKATGQPGSVDPVQYLIQHGYHQVTGYQPDSRYWPFQWIEFGSLAALALALLAVGFWVVGRRPA